MIWCCYTRVVQLDDSVEEGTHQHVNTLDNIQEHLILAVSNPLSSPRHSVCNGGWWSRLYFKFM